MSGRLREQPLVNAYCGKADRGVVMKGPIADWIEPSRHYAIKLRPVFSAAAISVNFNECIQNKWKEFDLKTSQVRTVYRQYPEQNEVGSTGRIVLSDS